MLTNPIRQPPEKKTKDIEAVKELLYHIEKSEEHRNMLLRIYKKLSKKQLKTLKDVCSEYQIEFPGCLRPVTFIYGRINI